MLHWGVAKWPHFALRATRGPSQIILHMPLKHNGESPSGKATRSGRVIRGFESLLPSHYGHASIDPLALANISDHKSYS